MFISTEIEAEFKKKLIRKKKLTIKIGFDPTAPDLHLGHTVLLTAARKFQDQGHRIVFLIGDFTAKIGDPTGKNITRPPLSEANIKANSLTYERQVFKILNKDKTEIRFNSEWLEKLKLQDLIRLTSSYSLARIIEREDFKNRITNNHTIGMHELLYPLLQGYDSVILNADLEIGGQDQLFNILVGRNLMRHFGLEPQTIITFPLLEGIDGKLKMSKSLGNCIGLEEDPNSQFGKIMSISDDLMWKYYKLLSSKSNQEILNLKKIHPRDAKIALALEIIEKFHCADSANHALSRFNDLFGEKYKRVKIPSDAPCFEIREETSLLRILFNIGFVDSNSDAKRLIKQGSVFINGKKIDNDYNKILENGNYDLRIGKTRFAKLKVLYN